VGAVIDRIVSDVRPAPRSVHMSAIGVLRSNAGVLMVESQYPGMETTFWALPGGMLEPSETVAVALAREVREETGLQISGHPKIVALIELLTDEGSADSLTFVLEPASWSGGVAPNDPDGSTVRAGFVPVGEAIHRLQSLPWGLSEPIVRHLRGLSAGGVWAYRWRGASPWDGGGPAELLLGPDVLEGHS
jgi:8-oxo-dGTP diphosphatase